MLELLKKEFPKFEWREQLDHRAMKSFIGYAQLFETVNVEICAIEHFADGKYHLTVDIVGMFHSSVKLFSTFLNSNKLETRDTLVCTLKRVLSIFTRI